ncbi:MAG TPA: rhomboid family intramembrane serine protease [Nitrososphaerales archaeon]|nr:rhomboid family intramembrane serine protease [Nitrososphaerales archaeon]
MLPLYDLTRPIHRPFINYGLIVINAVVFVFEVVYTNNFAPQPSGVLFDALGLVPYYLVNTFNGAGLVTLTTLITSMFLHAGVLHLAGNMLFLFVFGGNVEDAFGHKKYLGFYLLAGIAGGLTQTYLSVAAGPPDIYAPSIGASGAISGVMAAYLIIFPRTRIVSYVAYFILPIRAFWFVGFWFLLQLLFFVGGVNTGVAYGAHIGGFVAGLTIAAAARPFVKKREESEL